MDRSKFNRKKEWRKFSFGLSSLLLVVAFLQWYQNSSLFPYFIISALITFLIGLIIPIIVKPLFIIFSYVGFILNWIMTRIILIILFYFIFAPIGLIMKLIGKKFLDVSFKNHQASYWVDIDTTKLNKSSNFKRQF